MAICTLPQSARKNALADCKESKTIYSHKNISTETNATLKLNFEQLKPGERDTLI